MAFRRSDEGSSGMDVPIDADTRAAPSIAEMFLGGLYASGVRALAGTPVDPAGPATDGTPERAAVIDTLNLHVDDGLEAYAEWATFGLPHYGETEPAGWAERAVSERVRVDGALGDYLEQLPPGERLGKVLTAIDPTEVDDFSVVEVVAAYKRMEAWAAAKAARAAAVLAERPSVNPTWPGTVPGRTRGECVVGQELSMRLRTSKQSSIQMVAAGRAFGAMFEPTGQALERGLIDSPRAMAIVNTLIDLPAEVAMAAQWEVLDKAPGRTLRQVQQDLAKAVIAVDPEAADARHRAARTKRRVNRPRPLADGMAHMSAVLPATDAIALDTALEAATRAARNNGDARTLDQLRADSLALMGHGALALGYIGPHPGWDCPCGCSPASDDATPGPTSADLSHGVEIAPATNAADPPPKSNAAPLGPSVNAPPGHAITSVTGTAEPPPDIDTAPAGTSAGPPVRDDSSGGVLTAVTQLPPADDRVPGSTCAPPPVDDGTPRTVPAGPLRSGAADHGDTPAGTPLPPVRVADAPPRPGQRLPDRLPPLVKLGSLGGGRADIRITVPLDVLLPDEQARELGALERDAEPVAELEGYGPIPPLLARALSAGGVWRRLVTDPTGVQVLDVGRTRYQPPTAIAELVRERDGSCIRPGCSAPARTADLDHIHEWQHGGVTSADNLGPLCRADHRTKSVGVFSVAYGSDRTYAWTTATGHGYLRRPDGTVVTLPRRTADGLRKVCKEHDRTGRAVAPVVVDRVLTEVAAGTDVGGRWAPSLSPEPSAWPRVEHAPSWGGDDAPPF